MVSRSDAQEVAQQPPPAPQPAPAPAPPKPVRSAPLRDTEGDNVSIAPLFWLTRTRPTAHSSSATNPGDLDYGGKSKYGLGGIITIPTRSENSIQISYFRVTGSGFTTANKDIDLFTAGFLQGDEIFTSYKIENYKLSWNYLTFPHPSNGAMFRLKTLWEIQYLKVDSTLFPPIVDNNVPSPLPGAKSILYPTLGLGVEFHGGKHVVFEAKGSGFALLHHANIWDTEASLILRLGRVEAFVGGKAYHFQTSPKAAESFHDTLFGPTAGLRWVFR
jgi:hypothetical protein